MEDDADPIRRQWDIPRSAQRRLFRALPLGRKLTIAADLADLVRALQRRRSAPPSLAPAPWPQGLAARSEGEVAGIVAEEGRKQALAFGSAGLRSLGSGLRSLCLVGGLAAMLACPVQAADGAKPTGRAPVPATRVIKFVRVPEVLEEQGPRPKNVWVYGRFTARTAVSDGLFLASVNEGINWPDWEENFNLIDNPGNYVFRRVVFQTKTPLPEIRKGTKFSIPKEHPARLVEIDLVDGTITRMVLESPPVIESQIGAGRRVKPEDPSTKHPAEGKEPPRRVVYFKQLGSIAQIEGSRPENLWVWGNFSARSNLRDGIFTATPAGVESRRVIEWIVGAALIYPVSEIPSRVIFYVHRPRKIQKGDRIEITAKHPAKVRRLFLAGGVLTWLDLDPPRPSPVSIQLGSTPTGVGTPAPAPSPASPGLAPGVAAPITAPSAASSAAEVSAPAQIPSPGPVATESQ